MKNRFNADAKFVNKPTYVGRVISKGINKGDKKPYIIVAIINDDGQSVLAKVAFSNYRGKETLSFATLNRNNQIIAVGNSEKKYIEVDDAGHRYVNNWLLPVDVENKPVEQAKQEAAKSCDELAEVQKLVGEKKDEQPQKVEKPVVEPMPIYTQEELEEAEEEDETPDEVDTVDDAESIAIEYGYDLDEFSYDKHRFHQSRNKDDRKKGVSR